MHSFLEHPRIRPRFRALAATIVPQAAALREAEWLQLERIVAHALRERPPAMRRQLRLFIQLLDLLPLFRWGRPFRRLGRKRRARFLCAVERAPLFLVRRGFWGLRTLVFMGYYGREETHAALGYGASRSGWLGHPLASDAARRRTSAREAERA